MASPIDAMIMAAARCVRCGAKMGECDCWRECRCGRYYPRDGKCENPLHEMEKCADELAEMAATCILSRVVALYPEPMKHASGGFRKTLRAHIEQEVKGTVLDVLLAKEEAKPFRRGVIPSAPDLPHPAAEANTEKRLPD
jgi:hypothetical protein